MRGQKKKKVKKAGFFSYLRDRFSIWCDVLRKPDETFAKEKKNANLMQGAKDIVTLPIAFSIVGLVLSMIVAIALGEIERSTMAIPLGFVLIALGSCIALLIGWLIFSSIGYAVAHLLGGKGKFKEHAYTAALWQTSTLPFALILSIIPTAYLAATGFFEYFCTDWDNVLLVAFAIQVIAVIWPLMLSYRAIRKVHELSAVRSAISALVSPGLAVIVALLLLGSTFYAIKYYSMYNLSAETKAWRYSTLAFCVGVSFDKMPDFAKAIGYLDRAIELDPDNPDHYLNRGVYKYGMNDSIGMYKDLAQAISLNPNNATLYFFRGYIEYRIGNITGAKADIEKVHALDSSMPDFETFKAQMENASKKGN